jgi:hypothetical protein
MKKNNIGITQSIDDLFKAQSVARDGFVQKFEVISLNFQEALGHFSFSLSSRGDSSIFVVRARNKGISAKLNQMDRAFEEIGLVGDVESQLESLLRIVLLLNKQGSGYSQFVADDFVRQYPNTSKVLKSFLDDSSFNALFNKVQATAPVVKGLMEQCFRANSKPKSEALNSAAPAVVPAVGPAEVSASSEKKTQKPVYGRTQTAERLNMLYHTNAGVHFRSKLARTEGPSLRPSIKQS